MGTTIDLEPIKALKEFSFGNTMVLGRAMLRTLCWTIPRSDLTQLV